MADTDRPPGGEFLLFPTEDGQTKIQVRFDGETVWLTQAALAELYQTSPQNITMHIAAIVSDDELEEAATCKEYLQVRKEGARQVRRSLKHYNLAMILAVGYRVRSPRGTQFRQWASSRLEEYLVKGFTMDDARLKNPPGKGHTDYFDELLERIRDIRASERRVYLRVREVLALAADYAASEPETQVFFQTGGRAAVLWRRTPRREVMRLALQQGRPVPVPESGGWIRGTFRRCGAAHSRR